MATKCPKCEKIMSHVNLETMDIHQNFKKQWHGVVYTCPLCNTALSVSMDPTLLRNDTIDGVIHGLRK